MKNFILKHKVKITVLIAAAIVLPAAFFAGTDKKSEITASPSPTVTAAASPLPITPIPTESAVLQTPVPSEVPAVSEVPSAERELTDTPEEELPREQTFSVSKNEEKRNTCTLTVRCDEILKNIDKLNPEKRELIPKNGIIFSGEVEINEGESVFTVLLREMQKQKIHMEFVNTPSTNSAYVKAINNIYEFDCGGFSGWTYTVNGKMQSVGCSQCILHPGDNVEWKYVCELPLNIG